MHTTDSSQHGTVAAREGLGFTPPFLSAEETTAPALGQLRSLEISTSTHFSHHAASGAHLRRRSRFRGCRPRRPRKQRPLHMRVSEQDSVRSKTRDHTSHVTSQATAQSNHVTIRVTIRHIWSTHPRRRKPALLSDDNEAACVLFG